MSKPKPKNAKPTAEEVLKEAPETLRRLRLDSTFFAESQIKQIPAFQSSGRIKFVS